MYYKKNLIGLLVCSLFVTRAAYGSYIDSYTNSGISHITVPKIIPTENLITEHPLISKSKEIPRPQVYTKFIKETINLEDFNYTAPNKKIICPISIEEANALLDGHFGGNIDAWSKFLTYCHARYGVSYNSAEKKLIEIGTSIKKSKIEELRAFYAYVISNYTTLLLDKGSLIPWLSSIEPSKRPIIRSILEQYFNNLMASWDQESKNATDPSELEGLIASHKIKEIEGRIFKFIQCFGYYDFFAYILSDDFTNEYTIDAVLFEKIIISAQTNILKFEDKKETFTDLLSLFRNKIKEYTPEDAKYKSMGIFITTCNEEANKLKLNLEAQASEYMKKVQQAETELEKIKIQAKQRISNLETEKAKLNSKIVAYEEKTKESQSEISVLEKKNTANESEKKQLQIAAKNQEDVNNTLKKEIEKLKKEAERSKETIDNLERANKEYVDILKNLEKKLEQKTQELNSVTKDSNMASEYNKQLQQQNEQIKKEQSELKKQAQLYEQSLENAKKQSDKTTNQFENQLTDLKKKLTTATEQVQLWQQKNEDTKKQQIALDKQREQKTKDQDVAAKLAKQQNEDLINDLKKANQQLEQQIKQLSKQSQLLKPQEKQKLSAQQQGDDFFNMPKSVDREKVIANLQQIQQEFQEAQVIPDLKANEGGWPKLAFVIDFLIQKYTTQDK